MARASVPAGRLRNFRLSARTWTQLGELMVYLEERPLALVELHQGKGRRHAITRSDALRFAVDLAIRYLADQCPGARPLERSSG